MNHRYLVVNRVEEEVEKLQLDSLVERIRGIERESLVLAYDLHAGFNIPSNVELRELLKRVNKKINIDLAVIDERRQSDDSPYSPTSVQVTVGNKVKRRSVYQHRHAFVSEIPFNRAKIIGAYKELLGDDFCRYSGLINRLGGESIGDFLEKLTEAVLIDSLQDLENVTIRNTRFDKFQGVTKTSHPVTYHEDHDVLYLGQHKAAYDRATLDFLVSRFKQLGEKPYFLVIPIDPQPYFKK